MTLLCLWNYSVSNKWSMQKTLRWWLSPASLLSCPGRVTGTEGQENAKEGVCSFQPRWNKTFDKGRHKQAFKTSVMQMSSLLHNQDRENTEVGGNCLISGSSSTWAKPTQWEAKAECWELGRARDSAPPLADRHHLILRDSEAAGRGSLGVTGGWGGGSKCALTRGCQHGEAAGRASWKCGILCGWLGEHIGLSLHWKQRQKFVKCQ